MSRSGSPKRCDGANGRWHEVRAAGLLFLFLAVLATAGLTACGGGSGSTSSTSTQSVPNAISTSAPTTTTSAAKPPSASHSSGSASSGGTGSAGFRAKGADNSIPDYGAEASASERDRAAAALSAYLQARSKGEWGRTCPYLSASLSARIKQLGAASKPEQSCAAVIATYSRGPAASHADTLTHGLAALRVKGQSAFALYYGPRRQKYVMPMASEAGTWKVTQLSPIAYPPGTPALPGG